MPAYQFGQASAETNFGKHNGMSQALQPFELYALRYGRHRNRSASENYLGGADFHDSDSDLDYYVWVARRSEEIYLVDTGFDEAAAKKRGRELLIPVESALELIGIQPRQIRNVIITHLHYDHAGTMANFPDAIFHVQDKEAAYVTGRHMCHSVLRQPFDVDDIVNYVRILYQERIRFHSGDSEIAPGLSVHWVGGHTDGLQVVRVWTQRGWVVLASDASHLYGNMERKHPFPLVFHVGDMLEGYTRVHQLAESPQHIVPGHDPDVMRRYPAPDDKGQGYVVRLDVDPLG